MTTELETLPRMIARATALLVAATSAAEIIEASQEASLIYDAAKVALRFAKLKDAHVEVCETARKMMADALTIEARAQCRLADEYDAAQKRGEVHKRGGQMGRSRMDIPDENIHPAVADIGITSKQIHLARKVRDAEQREPGVIRKTLDEKLDAGGEPMRADINRIIKGNKSKSSLQPQRRKNNTVSAETGARLILDEGKTYQQAEKITGLTNIVLRAAVAREEGRREPIITRDMLSLTAQQKLDAAIRQHKARLDASFHQAVNARVKEWLEDTILPRHRKEQAEAKAVMNARRGIMSKATFNAIRRGLHPDSRLSISDQMLGEAFDTFMALEKRLLKEADSPTTFVDIPSSLDEWDKKKAMKRTAGPNAIRRRA